MLRRDATELGARRVSDAVSVGAKGVRNDGLLRVAVVANDGRDEWDVPADVPELVPRSVAAASLCDLDA